MKLHKNKFSAKCLYNKHNVNFCLQNVTKKVRERTNLLKLKLNRRNFFKKYEIRVILKFI